ncbi:prephenate dehydrogenase [Helicobacter cetorum]|uniref:prephenate dehydrogenase n=1 Tax=Helicobacter cetorum TaxID=138563 RepID=UPI000CF11B68|nr:prephenate dehydrogenase [Helicobacter cetorum]
MQAGIIGLGLMGGSLGLDLQKLGYFKNILGYDSNALHAQQALTLGLVDECVEFEKILECDVIFLAIPVEGIINCLQKMTSIKENATIIDLGGAKHNIIKSVPQNIRKNFIAAHPMCGTEFYGPKASVKGLYENALVILCDLEDSGAHQVKLAKEIFLGIKARLVKMKSSEHDAHTAYISHLPHVLSYALANSVLKQKNPEIILSLAGGGFRDMSRISKSSPLMWKDIFKQNRDNILEAIEKCETEITQAKTWIKNNDYESLEKWMAQANKLQEFM